MRKYKPVASYNSMDNPDEIMRLYPFGVTDRKGEAEQIRNLWLLGYGSPSVFPNIPDEESIITDEDIKLHKDEFFLTPDGKHGVWYTDGLMKDGKPYAFFIDIYELFETDEEEILSDLSLEKMAQLRENQNKVIKSLIIKEFKERFKTPGEGLDFFQYCAEYVHGTLNENGEIGKLLLDDNGEVVAVLGGEYEDPVVPFGSKYFACDNWPQLLINVRRGIREGWLEETDEC